MHEPTENTVPSEPGALKPPSITMYVVLTTLVVLVTLVSVTAITLSLSSNATRTERLVLLPLAALLLLFPGRIVQVLIRRRRKTGRWSLQPSDEERAAYRARYALRTPQQVRREAIWLWLGEGLTLCLYIFILWSNLRDIHRPLQNMDRLLIGFWVLMMAYFLFSIYRRMKRKPTA